MGLLSADTCRLCKITSHGHRTDQDSLETSWSMLVTQLRIWATSLSMPTTAPWLRVFFLILLLCWSQSMFNRGCFDKRAPIKKWILHSCYSRFCKNLAAVVTDRSDGCTNRAKASSSQTVTCWNFLPKLMPRSFRELSFWFAARTHSGPSKPVFSRTILSNFTCQADYICIVLSWLGHKCQLFCYELKYHAGLNKSCPLTSTHDVAIGDCLRCRRRLCARAMAASTRSREASCCHLDRPA